MYNSTGHPRQHYSNDSDFGVLDGSDDASANYQFERNRRVYYILMGTGIAGYMVALSIIMYLSEKHVTGFNFRKFFCRGVLPHGVWFTTWVAGFGVVLEAFQGQVLYDGYPFGIDHYINITF